MLYDYAGCRTLYRSCSYAIVWNLFFQITREFGSWLIDHSSAAERIARGRRRFLINRESTTDKPARPRIISVSSVRLQLSRAVSYYRRSSIELTCLRTSHNTFFLTSLSQFKIMISPFFYPSFKSALAPLIIKYLGLYVKKAITLLQERKKKYKIITR